MFDKKEIINIIKMKNYLSSEILNEGTLIKRADGKYCIAGTDIFYSDGDTIEYYDDINKSYDLGLIEYNKEGYYIFTRGNAGNLDGLKVRYRGIQIRELIL